MVKLKNKLNIFITLSLVVINSYSQVAKLDYSNPKTYILGGISIEGNFRFEKEAIIKYTKLKQGENIKIPSEKLSNTIKKLWSTKMFDDISISVDKINGNQIYLKINLKEVPMISKIKFYGIKKSRKEEFINDLSLRRGKMITEDLKNKIKTHINNYFIDKGFLNCKTFIVTRNDTTKNYSSTVHVRVDKGKKVKIKKIFIEGNNVISNRKIRKSLKKTKEKSWWNFFRSSKLIDSEYENDKKNVITTYKKEGFRDARILSDSIIKNDDNTVSIKLNISEGKKYYFGDIKWLGNTIFDKEMLDFYLGIKKGDIYNSELLEERLFGKGGEEDGDIHSMIMNKGHLFSQVTPIETQINGDTINIGINILEGPIASIEKIIVTGNDRTNDEVIYRNIRTRPGQLFNKDLIKRTYRELAQLQYFDPQNIGISPKPNPQKGTVDIEYSLIEKSSSQIELQGGWGAGRIIGSLGLSFNNFSFRDVFTKKEWKPVPLGSGQNLSLRAQATIGFQNYSLTLADPWISGGRYPLGFSFNINYSITEQITNFYTYATGNGRLGMLSLNASITKRLPWPDDFFSMIHSISFQRYNLKDYQWQIYKDFDNGSSNNINYTFGLQRKSSGPNPIYPMGGSDLEFSIKVTPPFSLFNGVDYNNENLKDQDRFAWLEYYKLKFKGTLYNNIWNKFVLATKVEFGYMSTYNKDVGVPPFERFVVGGSGTAQFVAFDGREIIGLRGYTDGSLTSGTGGDPIYSKIIAELRYPIILKPSASIYGLIFAEGGNTFQDFETFSPFQMRRSTGAGVRIFMPMFGLLGFDFGYGLDPLPGNERSWEFHFLLGQNF